VVRETLRMTPDIMVPGEIRGTEAGAVAHIAEAGRPTMTTIHARSARAALLRFARLATSDIPGNSFARQPLPALRVIAESFHLLVHVGFSRRLGRRIVQSAALLDGLDAHGEPILLPLIESKLDADDTAPDDVRVSWECYADLDGQQLVWRDQDRSLPAAISALLADVPNNAGRSAAQTATTEHEMTDLLLRARDLLPYPDQSAQVVQLLERAYQLDPEQREIWSLIDRLIASNAEVRDSTASAVEAALQQMRAAMQARNLAALRAAANAEQSSLLLQAALNQDSRWQELRAAGMALIEQAEDLEASLAAAYAIARQHQDFTRALWLLQRFQAQDLPLASARQLLEARAGLLEAQCRLLGPSGSGVLAQQLRMTEQQLAALDRSTPMPQAMHEAGVDADSSPVHEDLALLGDRAMALAADWQTAADDDPEWHEGRAQANANDDGALRAESEAALFDEPLPINVAAAAEVGDWRRLWQQITADTAQERDDDPDHT
jgi:hypothetical protein